MRKRPQAPEGSLGFCLLFYGSGVCLWSSIRPPPISDCNFVGLNFQSCY